MYALGAGISFVLLTFMGDIEQGLMAVLLAFFVLAYCCLTRATGTRLSTRIRDAACGDACSGIDVWIAVYIREYLPH